jgi:hypothetical protein
VSNTPRNTTQRDRDRARIAKTKANCGICGDPIDYTLKWPDPMCFVVDHVKAVTKGGADRITNKQAAHNTCNSTKRARDFAPIVRRSGSLT